MHTKYWAVIILATAAICAGGVYYIRQSPADLGPIVTFHQKFKIQQPTTATPPSQAASMTADDMKGWKTYTNSQYGFELEYPSLASQDTVMELDTTTGYPPHKTKDISFSYWDEKSQAFSPGSFDVFVDTNDSGDTLNAWFAKNVDADNILKDNGNFKFKDISGGQMLVLDSSIPIPAAYLDKAGPIGGITYLMPDSKKYIFTLGLSEDSSISVQDYIDQILSTFKFTK